MKYSVSFKLQVVKFEQWQELFGESDDEEEFHGF